MESEKYTPLYEIYKDLHPHLVNFHSWILPVYFSSIKEETIHTRKKVTLFDISHMGEIFIEGENAEKFINYLITNDIINIPEFKVVYTPICNEKGGIIDDILVYKFNKNRFLLIVNASNIEKDLKWINQIKESFANINIKNESNNYSMIAIQGPLSDKILEIFLPASPMELKYYTFAETLFDEFNIILSRTGYTGEKGFELIFKNEFAPAIWEKLWKVRDEFSLIPAGLGARDVLRIEAGYPLYGNELSEDINPFEANIGWTVKLNKEFIGNNSLKKLKDKIKKIRTGIIMEEKRIPREKNEIYHNETKIGYISSGTFSFNLNKSIGMAYIDDKYLDSKDILIKIHKKFYNGKITKLPFINNIKSGG